MTKWAKTLWAKWKRFGELVAEVVTFILFTVLYLFLFSPVALIQKLLRKRFLPVFKEDAKTFFLEKAASPATLESMRRQG